MKRTWPYLVLFLILALLTSAFFLVLQPYWAAGSSHVPGSITAQAQEDGTMVLSWDATPKTHFYTVTLTHPTQGEVFREVVKEPTCTLPAQASEVMTLRITPGRYYEILSNTRARDSDNFIEVTASFLPPRAEDLTYRVDTLAKTVTASVALPHTDTCYMTWAASDGTVQEQPMVQGSLTVTLGQDAPLPAWDESLACTFRVQRQQAGLTIYGLESNRIQISGQLFLDRDMPLSLTELGDNRCALAWEEASGDGYEVRIRQAGQNQWSVLQTLDSQTFTFETARLQPVTTYEFQIAATGVQPEPVSNIQVFTTGVTPLYCTVWPTQNLRAYTTPQKASVAGSVQTGKAYCVLGEENGMFAVRLEEQTCYIDSRYCMINLPEYLGNLCNYEIANSYESKFLVHEYEMPGISGQVVSGYEDVRLYDGSYLVPLLYPTAKMLHQAAKTAQDYGYRLKIYDAYRPNVATVDLFNRMEGMLDTQIPNETFTGKAVTDLVQYNPTYRLVMTNNVWPINYFLARGVSKHNLGVAVDLTLENLGTGTEVPMQTSMHDLSWYSCLQRNNDTANILSKVMKSAGFNGLASEWWHFQDDDSRMNLGLAAVINGVSPEGWMFDGKSWQYRNSDGTLSPAEA